MLVYYPMTAVNWLLGVTSCVLFLWFGASGTEVAASVWLMLYSDAAALQVGLYLWNRRHNVSPHEPSGSGGLAGMGMSALSAPIYLKSLGAAVLRRPCRFVITPKGADASADLLRTFRVHLCWAGVLATSLAASFVLGHTHVAMRTWAFLGLAISLAPVAVWYGTGLLERRRSPLSRPRRAPRSPRPRPPPARWRPPPPPSSPASRPEELSHGLPADREVQEDRARRRRRRRAGLA
ncbi:hypothetical protein ACFQVA_30195 [Actinomadura keratinilytica]